MTKQQHNLLYNIGMEMKCDNLLKRHQCPRKEDYEYSMYWLAKYVEKDKTIKLRFKMETGEEFVHPEIPYDKCLQSESEGRVKAVPIPGGEPDDYREMLKKINAILPTAIPIIAWEKTKVLKEIQAVKKVSMFDFMDAIDTDGREVVRHFLYLIKCLMGVIHEDKEDGKAVIERITALLKTWDWVFETFSDFVAQEKLFIRYMLIGLQDIQYTDMKDDRIIWARFEGQLAKKEGKAEIKEFLFLTDTDRKIFQESATVLYAFIEKYKEQCKSLEKEIEQLMDSLKKYIQEGLSLNSIPALSELNLESNAAMKANAELILRYVNKREKLYGVGNGYELIA